MNRLGPGRSARILAVVAIAAAAPFAGCSDGDSSQQRDGSADTDAEAELEDPDQFSGADDTFKVQVEHFRSELEAATDRCDVLAATYLVPLVPPADRAEGQLAVTALLLQLEQMAAFTDSTETSNLLRSSAVGIGEFAEEAGYDPAVLDLDGDGPDTPASDDYREGVELWMTEADKECSATTLDQ